MALGPNVINREAFGSGEGVLPPEVVRDLYTHVGKESLALRLAGTMPININGATATIPVGKPVAGIVGEGERKPLIKGGYTNKSIKPIKAAAIIVHTKEARLANPYSFYEGLQEQLSSAIARAVDMAIFHGKNGLSNTEIAGVEFLDQTKNVVRLGTAKPAEGGLQRDLVNGFGMVAGKGGAFNAFAADSTLVPELLLSVDAAGRPLFQSAGLDLSDKMGTLMGLPVAYDEDSVSGFMGAVPDTMVRAYGGAFKDNIRVGFVEQVTYKRTDTATIVDGDNTYHLFQDNLEAILVEAIFGWVIKDVNHFAKYTIAPPAYAAGGDYPAGSLVTEGKAEYRAKKDVKEASTAPSADSGNWEKVSA